MHAGQLARRTNGAGNVEVHRPENQGRDSPGKKPKKNQKSGQLSNQFTVHLIVQNVKVHRSENQGRYSQGTKTTQKISEKQILVKKNRPKMPFCSVNLQYIYSWELAKFIDQEHKIWGCFGD